MATLTQEMKDMIATQQSLKPGPMAGKKIS